jgi:hypothetical protein
MDEKKNVTETKQNRASQKECWRTIFQILEILVNKMHQWFTLLNNVLHKSLL